MHPESPKACLAISGNDLIGLRILAWGVEPGGSGVLNGESSKYDPGRGSPLSSRPIRIEVLQVMKPKDTRARVPPIQPELAFANGRPSNPTPWTRPNVKSVRKYDLLEAADFDAYH